MTQNSQPSLHSSERHADQPLVDSHVHVFTRYMPVLADARHRLDYDFTYNDLIETLDTHGVRFAVIAAGSPWGDYNDYTLEALRAHRDRLRGTIICKPTTERAVLEAMAEDGVVGVRLPFFSLKQKPDITTFEYRRFLRRLADLDWHVHLHTEEENLPALLPTLEASGVRIVIDHLGRPNPHSGINGVGFRTMLRSLETGRLWVKFSGAYRVGASASACAQELLRVAGPDRLVWASDCPFAGYERSQTYRSAIDWLIQTVPDRFARAKIFGETARHLYFGRNTKVAA